MSFTLDNIMVDGDIEVILRVDSALDVTDEEYEAYLQDLDETKLKVKEGGEPTRFVMKRNVPFKHATRIENNKVTYRDDGEVAMGMSFVTEEVRATLKDIKYGPSTPPEKRIVLKMTGDGLVDEKLMAAFMSAGIVQNLYNARANVLKNSTTAGLKKS